MYKYLSVGNDAKTVKGQAQGYLTGILYMAPHTIAGGRTMCPFSTAGCRAVCLYTAGHGAFTPVQEARIRKTKAFLADPKAFVKVLMEDVAALKLEAKRRLLIPAVRLNGTTDIMWERFAIMLAFSEVQFYDYTKWPPFKRLTLPPNYHLTFSYSEAKHSVEWSTGWMDRGVNTAVVFRGGLPKAFLGRHVINGDETDLRFTDDEPVIVGLKAKGKARKDEGIGLGQFVQRGT